MSAATGPIVVGYDGSPSSLNALRWAADQATEQHATLRIVEAFGLVVTARPCRGCQPSSGAPSRPPATSCPG